MCEVVIEKKGNICSPKKKIYLLFIIYLYVFIYRYLFLLLIFYATLKNISIGANPSHIPMQRKPAAAELGTLTNCSDETVWVHYTKVAVFFLYKKVKNI